MILRTLEDHLVYVDLQLLKKTVECQCVCVCVCVCEGGEDFTLRRMWRYFLSITVFNILSVIFRKVSCSS